MKKFFKVFFYSAGFASLNVFLQIVSAIMVSVLYIIFIEGPKLLSAGSEAFMTMDIEKILYDTLMPTMIIAGVLTLIIAWLLHVIFRRRFFERLSLKKVGLLFVGISFLAGIALQLPIGYILGLVENAGVAPEMFKEYAEMIEPLMSGQSLLMQTIVIGIMAPVVEEVLFRGLVFHQLRKNIPVAIALVIQAFLFGLAHLNIIQGSYAFLTGLLMGLSLLWSGSLLLPLLMHMGMNLSAVFLSYYGEGMSDSTYIALTIVSFVFIPACMILLYWLTKGKKNLRQADDLQIVS